MNKLIFSLCAFFMLISCRKTNVVDEVLKLNIEAFNAEADLQMRSNKIPGLQLLYVKDKESFSFIKGIKNVNTNQPVDEHTVFQAASMSKPLAAYVFLRLVERGVFSLDVPLSSYYTYSRLGNNPGNLLITGRQVLLHTSGLVNWTNIVGGELNVQFTPGNRYYYSGEGFQYLQTVIEHLTGKKLNELAEEEVFKPFGMNRSAFYLTNDMVDNRAAGHDVDQFHTNTTFTEVNANSAYSLLTTTSDYAKFIQKVFIERVGLSNKTYQDMLAIGVLQETSKPNVGRGLGIGIQNNEKGKSFYHGGSNPGFRSFFMVYPDDKEFFIYLSNSSAGYNLRLPFCDLFFGSTYTQYFL